MFAIMFAFLVSYAGLFLLIAIYSYRKWQEERHMKPMEEVLDRRPVSVHPLD